MGVHGLPPDLLITADPPERTGAAGGTRKGSLPFLRALRRGTGTLWKTELRRRPPARGGRSRKGTEENGIVETDQKSRIDSGRFVQNGKRQRLRIDLPNNFLKFFLFLLIILISIIISYFYYYFLFFLIIPNFFFIFFFE